jgi:hypothetical protein
MKGVSEWVNGTIEDNGVWRSEGVARRFKTVQYICIYTLTYCMKQSPSREAYRFVASQEIPRDLLNPMVHYRIYNCPPPVSILRAIYIYIYACVCVCVCVCIC